MRNLEESLFWEVLYRHQAVRAELAHFFEVSAATISRSANVLLAQHLMLLGRRYMAGGAQDVNKNWWVYSELDQMAGTLSLANPDAGKYLPRSAAYLMTYF